MSRVCGTVGNILRLITIGLLSLALVFQIVNTISCNFVSNTADITTDFGAVGGAAGNSRRHLQDKQTQTPTSTSTENGEEATTPAAETIPPTTSVTKSDDDSADDKSQQDVAAITKEEPTTTTDSAAAEQDEQTTTQTETSKPDSGPRFPNGTPVSDYSNDEWVDGKVVRFSNGDYIVKWNGEEITESYTSSNAEDMQALTKMSKDAMGDKTIPTTTAGTTATPGPNNAADATARRTGGPKINYGLWKIGLDDSVCFEETDGYGFDHDKSLNGARISHILSMVAGSLALLLTLIECIKCKIMCGKKLQGFVLFFAFTTGLCVFMVFGCAMCGGDVDTSNYGGLFGNNATSSSTAAGASMTEHWENFNHIDHNTIMNDATNTVSRNQYLGKLVSSFKSKCEWEEGASYNLVATLLYFICMLLNCCTPAANPMFGGKEESKSSPISQDEEDGNNDLQLRPEWTDKEIA